MREERMKSNHQIVNALYIQVSYLKRKVYISAKKARPLLTLGYSSVSNVIKLIP